MNENTIAHPGQLALKVDHLEDALTRGAFRIDDIYALNLLNSLMAGYPFLPFTGASLRPYCLVHMLNDIIVNNRQNIIEFGSGLSTIMTGRLIKKNGLATTVVSVEHDEGWVNMLRQIVKSEELDGIITLIHAPLTRHHAGSGENDWYDEKVIMDNIMETRFDMVIIDGPPAWQTGKGRARYPALPFVVNRLCKNFSVYLDDANRPGEQSIILQWERDYGIEFNITGGTLAFYYTRSAYHTDPFTFY